MVVNGLDAVIEWNGESYDSRHGGPFDRGTADNYYWRGIEPHYFVGATYSSLKIEKDEMTDAEIEAYLAGYAYNEAHGDKKDWG